MTFCIKNVMDLLVAKNAALRCLQWTRTHDLLSQVQPETTHHRSKDHWLDGLEFDWAGFDKRRKYLVNLCVLSSLIQSSKTVGQLYCHTYPYSECSQVQPNRAQSKNSPPVVNVKKTFFGGNIDFHKIKKWKKFVLMSEPALK